jgi:cytochrome c2
MGLIGIFSGTLIRRASHLLVIAILIVLPALWFHPRVFWRLASDQYLLIGAFVLAYFAAVYFALRISRTDRQHRFSRILLAGSAAIGGCFAALVIWFWLSPNVDPGAITHYSMLTSLGVALACFLLVAGVENPALWQPIVLGLVLFAGLVAQYAYLKQWLPRPEAPVRTVTHRTSSLYQFEVVNYHNWIPQHWRKGGGIAPWGADTVLATGDGALHLIKGQSAGNTLSVTTIPRKVPLNADEFVHDAREIFQNTKRPTVESSRFRVADVLATERDGISRILVTHHVWHRDKRCFALRLSMLEGARSAILDAAVPLEWKTVFETSPCLTLNTTNPSGPRFEGLENGGRMVSLNDSELLLSVGDHGFNGVSRPEQLAQDPTAQYGKVLRVNIDTGQATIHSSGHRNPQGLHRSAAGALWSTEHGPRGGDEINLIKEGANYGWPLETFGTEYSRLSWPLNPQQQSQNGFEHPVYAFVPSVGISSLTTYEGNLFPLWRGDLLVGTLNGHMLYRVRVDGARAQYLEPIPLNEAIRDVMVGAEGEIVLWTDARDLIYLRPAANAEGDVLVAMCTACHGFNSWDRATVGPNLSRIVGKAVAAGNDFNYSGALRDFGGRWTRSRLDRFLADPQGVVPGTLMSFPGIKDAKQRAMLVNYLETMPVD